MRVLLSAAIALAALGASACASPEPVMLASDFAPKNGRIPWAYSFKGISPATCRISIADVVDARSDKQSMGRFGGRYVRHEDAVGWVRSGLETLIHDKRFRFVSLADVGDGVLMNVSLLKAYMEGLATSKNATVVLRVSYVRGAEFLGENTFRGDFTDVNWGSGDDEARDSLNVALQEALLAIDADLAARCSKWLEPKAVAAGQPL